MSSCKVRQKSNNVWNRDLDPNKEDNRQIASSSTHRRTKIIGNISKR